jgi:hypothetical protein
MRIEKTYTLACHRCSFLSHWRNYTHSSEKNSSILFLTLTGPRYRRPKEKKEKGDDEKRPRTAFSNEQLARLKVDSCRFVKHLQ